MQKSNFFHVGGSLPARCPSYIKRKSDKHIFQHLKDNQFCYVLAPRQTGKSSLKVRSMQRFKQEGYKCISIDMTSLIKSNTDEKKWYYNFFYIIYRNAGRPEAFQPVWKKNAGLNLNSLVTACFTQLIKTLNSYHVILYIDEIDALNAESMKVIETERFFLYIQSALNIINKQAVYLSIVVLGVTTSGELNPNKSANKLFNKKNAVVLPYFSQSDACELAYGLNHIRFNKTFLAREIIRWTGGQPFLTQKLFLSLSGEKENISRPEEVVFKHIEKLWLQHGREFNDSNLLNIHQRIRMSPQKKEILKIYTEIRKENKVFDTESKACDALKLSGLAMKKGKFIYLTNYLYEQLFDEAWLKGID